MCHDVGGSLEFFQVPELWRKRGIFESPRNMKKYGGNMKEYEEVRGKYEENMKKYEEMWNMNKI